MRLRGAGDVASKQDRSGWLNLREQGSEARRHLGCIEADDEKLANLFMNTTSFRHHYSICLFNSASKFSASRGVNRFKSTSRSLSSTGWERGVKMVNCVGRSDSLAEPGVRCSESRRSADSCSASTSRARTTTSFGNPASLATSMP